MEKTPHPESPHLTRRATLTGGQSEPAQQKPGSHRSNQPREPCTFSIPPPPEPEHKKEGEAGRGKGQGGRNQPVRAEVMTHHSPVAPFSHLSPHPMPGPLRKPSPRGPSTCRRGSPEDGSCTFLPPDSHRVSPKVPSRVT